MVNRTKKLPNIALKHKAGLSIIFAGFTQNAFKRFHSLMRAFALLTGKRIGDKSLFKNRIQNGEDRNGE